MQTSRGAFVSLQNSYSEGTFTYLSIFQLWLKHHHKVRRYTQVSFNIASNVSEDVTKQLKDFSFRVTGRFCVVHNKAQSSLLRETHSISMKATPGMPPTCSQIRMPPTCSVSKHSLVSWSSSFRSVKLSQPSKKLWRTQPQYTIVAGHKLLARCRNLPGHVIVETELGKD